MRNRILFLEWNSFGNLYIQQAFRQLHMEIDVMKLDTHEINTRLDSAYTEQLVKKIIGSTYYFVFSFNYYPIGAMACKACRVPYVSWTYDSPFIQLYSKTLGYDTNFAFIFDRGTCANLEEKGYNTYYLPMAAPMDGYKSILQNKDRGKRFFGDISFVGSLYNEPAMNMYRHMDGLKDYEKGYVDALIMAQKNVYGYNFIEKILSDNPQIVEKIREVCPVQAQGDGIESVEWTLANYFLSRRVTAIERTEIMEMLGQRYSVNLYTPGTVDIKGVKNCGKADYHQEAPHIFANSKINLNITLRSIQTGISLRAFDIMGCGGFLLSNYQEDYLELFEPDEDIVLYYSYEDLLDKVDFYLKNETERKRIALNGYQKVITNHTYLQRVETILDIVSEYWG